MAQPVQQQDPISSLLSEFGTRLTEIEEKQRLLKDRLLLIGENLISLREEQEKEFIDFKKEFKGVNLQLKQHSQTNRRIINELNNTARKSELNILERQFKMFQPFLEN